MEFIEIYMEEFYDKIAKSRYFSFFERYFGIRGIGNDKFAKNKWIARLNVQFWDPIADFIFYIVDIFQDALINF